MSNKKRHAVILVAGLGGFLLIPAETWAVQSCPDLFMRKAAVVTTNSTTGRPEDRSAKSGGANALIPRAEEPQVRSKEQIELQDRYRQIPNVPLITEQYIAKHKMMSDENGDHVEVFLYQKGDPFHPKSAAPALSNDRNDGSQNAIGASRGNQIITQQNSQAGALVDPSKISQTELDGIVRRYVTDVVFAHRPSVDSSSVEYIVNASRSIPETIQEALKYDLRIKNEGDFISKSPVFSLKNTGLKRYFTFIPEGMSQPVPARVLDLHRQNSPYGFNILIEWMTGLADGAMRTRHITMLKPHEIETIPLLNEQQQAEISQVFTDSLSPNEIKARHLAKALKVRTFGYTDFRRSAGTSDANGVNPLSMMSNISHLAVRGFIEDRFHDNLSDLLTAEERSQTLWNVLDVMGRLTPRYVLSRFNARGDGFEYAFVVTEDGQLKVSPHGHHGVNLKPQSLRLAHGRRVFAAGVFTMDLDGQLRVTLESNDFQEVDRSWGSRSAFGTSDNGDLHAFVSGVFALQAGHNVRTVDAKTADSYLHQKWADTGNGSGHYANAHDGFQNETRQDNRSDFGTDSGSGPGRAYRQKSWSEFNSQDAYDYIHNLRKEGTTGKSEANVDWDFSNPQARPLNMVDWLKATGRPPTAERDHSSIIAWAHYVLRTSPDMSLAQIKKSYRKLAMRFHPDRSEFFRESDASQVVNVAFKAIEADAGHQSKP